jgi:hypothetical protein
LNKQYTSVERKFKGTIHKYREKYGKGQIEFFVMRKIKSLKTLMLGYAVAHPTYIFLIATMEGA